MLAVKDHLATPFNINGEDENRRGVDGCAQLGMDQTDSKK